MKNPYAFPDDERQTGMTLRDWFAGQALAAMPNIKDDGCYSYLTSEAHYPARDAAWSAKAAYRIADAMLAERADS
jgi:hypothetical protein